MNDDLFWFPPCDDRPDMDLDELDRADALRDMILADLDGEG